jgi:hypothetical protein
MRRNTGHLVLTAFIAVAMLAIAPAAYAAKGNNSSGGGHGGKPTAGSGTISLVLLNSTDGGAHWGQWVTFNVATTSTTEPWVGLKCSQNGAVVSETWHNFFDTTSSRDFGLYSPVWTGGSADCTATLTNPQWAPLASTTFHVSA